MKKAKTKSRASGFSTIIVLFLIVIVIAVIGFIVFKSSNITTPITQSIPSKTEEVTPQWKTYTNAEAGFSLKYPPSVLFESETASATQSILSIAVEKLSSIPEDLPSLMGRTDALKEKAFLEKGGGETTIKIGSLYGSLDMLLSRFEICSVILNRSLTFYPGEYRVIISLAGPEKAIMSSMPDFFTIDPANCGDQQMWKKDKTPTFTETLAQKKGKGAAQEWYDTFDAIVKTITLSTPSVTPAPSSSAPTGWATYKNMTYGFEISYPPSYKALDSKTDLYGYPQGIVLLYGGGQAYDVVIEVWNTEAQYKEKYGPTISDVTVSKSNGKFITLLNSTHQTENAQIIASFKLN